VAEFAFRLKAQEWRSDSYYVAISQPVKRVTLSAATEEEATSDARTMLGAPRPGRYWRFWLVEATDARLVATTSGMRPTDG